MKLCECGCGRETKRSNGGKKSTTASGEYFRFVVGHYKRVGYATRFYRKHGGRLMHVTRAEQALGRPLPPKAVVHHADGSKNPDAPLVICENQAYHRLLHMRMRIKAAGGNPNTDRICRYCKLVKPITEFVRMRKAETWHCLICSRAHSKAYKLRLKMNRLRTDQGA